MPICLAPECNMKTPHCLHRVRKSQAEVDILSRLLCQLLSFGLLVIGLLVQYNQDILNDVLGMVTDMLKGAIDSIKSAPGGFGDFAKDITAEDIEAMIKELLQNISKPVIIVSSTFIVISGSGLLGGCCKSSCFLVIYSIFLVIIILAEAAFLALFILPDTMIDDYIKTALREGLQFNNFEDIKNGSSIISTIWLAIMDTLDCCGLDGFKDFEQTKWYNASDGAISPIACCKNLTAALAQKEQEIPDCTIHTWSNITNAEFGCYKAMKDKIFESQLSVGIFAGVCVVIFLVEAVLFFSAIAVIKENMQKKNKVHPSSRRQRRH